MIRLAILLAAGTALAAPGSALAQAMGGHSMGGHSTGGHSMAGQSMGSRHMPGMAMPAPARRTAVKPVRKKAAVRIAASQSVQRSAQRAAPRRVTRAPRRVAPARTAAGDTAGHDMSAMPGMDHAMPRMDHAMPEMDHAMPGIDHAMPGLDMGQSAHSAASAPMPGMTMTGTALPAGNAPPPAPPTDHYAARQFPAGEIARAHHAMARESGGQNFAQVMFNLAEVQVRGGKDGYRWDGEGWFGGDIDRFVVKTEGEGVFREGVEAAEVQALYSRAIDPYFNLQVGVRHDFHPTPSRTYATIGFEGLAPYWFEVSGALFLSDKGDVLGRLEGYYDQRITQRLILQPRVELNFAAQDVPATRIGAGVSDAELGLRLRYEFSRQFAPYIGVSYDAKTGRTADFARADGKEAASTSLVAGLHFWF